MTKTPIGWISENNTLRKAFIFWDFLEAMRYMDRVAAICEEMHHHPDWRNVYNTLYVVLTTHDAGNTITEKDIMLAEKMDEIFLEYKD